MRTLALCLLLVSVPASAWAEPEVCGVVTQNNEEGIRFKVERPGEPKLEISQHTDAGRELILLASATSHAFKAKVVGRLVFTLDGARKVQVDEVRTPTRREWTVRVRGKEFELPDGRRAHGVGSLASLLTSLNLPGAPVEVVSRTLTLETGQLALYVIGFKVHPTKAAKEFYFDEGRLSHVRVLSTPIWVDRPPRPARTPTGDMWVIPTRRTHRAQLYVSLADVGFMDEETGATCEGLGACLEGAQR